MLENHERLAILRLVQTSRPSNRQSLITAGLYAGQVVASAAILMCGFRYFHAKAELWALVSAVLVIQPVVEQSIAASLARIVANTVGGIIGMLVAKIFGDGPWQMLIALPLVILVCERLRLDVALRTACVSVVIVMTVGGAGIISSAEERLGAVVIGCVLGLVVQLCAEALRKWMGWRNSPESPLAPPATGPSGLTVSPEPVKP